MISRIQLSTVLLVAALIWGVLLVISGVSVSIGWIRYFSIVSGILLLLIGAFNTWLWHLPILQGWFVRRPDIRGTWKTIIRSKWKDPATGAAIQPIEGYMAIHQTYSSLSLRLMTRESCSELIGSDIVSFKDDTFRVAAIYRNEPKQLIREQSPIHNGAILLRVIGKPVTSLKGNYWTDRNTLGEIELTNRCSQLYHDFELANSAFQSQNNAVI
jgi:hypothetical protein